jgi:regulator of sirC expression with transglutaminase-like and TPR domain
MQERSQARAAFVQLIRRPDPEVPLGEAAMAIAWEDQGVADPRPELATLDTIAAAARDALAGASDGPARAAALGAVIGGGFGFRGDPRCYQEQDPANSHLNQVLERRRGLPILLSVIYLEVARRVGLPMQGLALPGHFLVRLRDAGGDLFLDPFGGGALWGLADCERQIASYYGEVSPELTAAIMEPPAQGAILARILRNLKQTYLALDDLWRALSTVERLLLLDGSDPGELRDRGLLRLRLGQTHAAIEDLERYAREHPAATDLGEIKSFVRELVGRMAPRN